MKLYNSLTQRVQNFKPREGKIVKMYVCGVTPYDTTHLGHAFTYVFFDVLQRYLKFKGYTLNYVQNVTDIDDDILKKAKEVGQDWRQLGNFWTKRFLDDMRALNVETPTHFIKATDSIDKIIQIIKTLLMQGYAYQKEGNIYFSIKKFKDYGKLSRLKKTQMLALAKERGGNPDDPLKDNPLDFLLWQKAKLGEPSWDSPWGKGRPGWHIECSAMSMSTLGEQLDIHGGGSDLIFPHHESEIAQSEGATGKVPFVKYWLHTGEVSYKGEKMSKSKGNLVWISDLLKNYSANAIRWLLLSNHWHKNWEFKEEDLNKAQKDVNKIESVILVNTVYPESNNVTMNQFKKYMDNDLDTPKSLTLLLNLANSGNNPKGAVIIYSILGFKI